jgi:hypothetical protein
MKLKLKVRSGTIPIDIEANTLTIAELKNIVSEQTKIPKDHMFIVFNQAFQNDSKSLSEADVDHLASNNQSIYLCFLTSDEFKNGFKIYPEDSDPCQPKLIFSIKRPYSSIFPCIKNKEQDRAAAALLSGGALFVLGIALATLPGLGCMAVALICFFSSAAMLGIGFRDICAPSSELNLSQ